MNMQEFEQRTGYYPSVEEYKVIEEFYMAAGVGKDAFCEAFKKNTDFLAEKIQTEVNCRHFLWQENVTKEKEVLLHKMKLLEVALEKEQEWKAYQSEDNVSQEKYDKLKNANGTRELSEEEAKDILYRWFGFAKEAVKIIYSVPVYEVNRHRQLRKIGEAERKPLYNATDWNYIRFDCAMMTWELCDDQLRPWVH